MSLVLSPEEFRVLDGLRFAPRKSFSGRVRGERLTKKKGISIEFADYREYSEGDDLRHLDWNVLARLQTPMMKTYQDEEDLAVYVVVDLSPSMDFGEPSKLTVGRQLACMFGYIGLCNQDAIYPATLPMVANPIKGISGVGAGLRGRSSYPALARWTTTLQPARGNSLAMSLREFATARLRQGLVILITDSLDPDAPSLVRSLGGRGHELCMVQVLTPEEIDPDVEGDLRLLDAETDAVVEITANSLALEGYKKNLNAHLAAINEACRRIGGRYTLVRTDESLVNLFKERLRREGWFAT
ncbi:MAG: DUF58 domain-containing protein [Fimbriimonadaceae bacterium]